jgi:glycosyltransferase involved in cell wall biosynthesis
MRFTPKVSIVLTTYNRCSGLKRSIDSIIEQSFKDFELIICDDCSTDGTQELVESYLNIDHRVRYIRNAVNLKMPENLNNGIKNAYGLYIANLHDGDVYSPYLIEKWVKALDDNKEAGIVFNDYGPESTFLYSEYSEGPINQGGGQFEVAHHYFRTLTSCIWGTVMVKKSVYDDLGLLDPRFGFISDVEMWLRITTKYKFVYIPEQLMELASREIEHPHRVYNWQYKKWEFLILKEILSLYKDILPEEVRMRRKKYFHILQYSFVLNLLLQLKHRKFGLAYEGIKKFASSNLFFLRIIALPFSIIFLGSKGDSKYWEDLYL